MNEDIRYNLAVKLAVDSLGIYPQSITDGDGKTTCRTEKQDGWNDCISQITHDSCILDDWLETLPEEILSLIQEEKIEVTIRKDEVSMWVLCNDLFYWACAEGEDFELNDLEDLKQALKESPKNGDLLWCCRKRRMRPQKPYYKYFNDEEAILFDACGPERDV